jgi:hypothetical protein
VTRAFKSATREVGPPPISITEPLHRALLKLRYNNRIYFINSGAAESLFVDAWLIYRGHIVDYFFEEVSPLLRRVRRQVRATEKSGGRDSPLTSSLGCPIIAANRSIVVNYGFR